MDVKGEGECGGGGVGGAPGVWVGLGFMAKARAARKDPCLALPTSCFLGRKGAGDYCESRDDR